MLRVSRIIFSTSSTFIPANTYIILLWIGREFCEELNEVYPKSICQSLHELQLLVYKRVFTLLNQPLYCLERGFCIGTICSVRIFQWMNNMKE